MRKILKAICKQNYINTLALVCDRAGQIETLVGTLILSPLDVRSLAVASRSTVRKAADCSQSGAYRTYTYGKEFP